MERMIPTRYPYGSVNIEEILLIEQKGDRFYFYDKCGRWLIDKQWFEYLASMEVKRYERNY